MGPQLYELDWIWLILVTRRFDTKKQTIRMTWGHLLDGLDWIDTRRKVHDIVHLNGACFIRLLAAVKTLKNRLLACRYVGQAAIYCYVCLFFNNYNVHSPTKTRYLYDVIRFTLKLT